MEIVKSKVGKCPVCKSFISLTGHKIGIHGPGKASFFCEGSNIKVKKVWLETWKFERENERRLKTISREYKLV